MCVIIHIKKGVDKNQEFINESIRKSAEFNKDGMGYIIKRPDNSVYIKKGFFDVEDLIKDIDSNNILQEDELNIHLRIGNKGKTNVNMCHPFIASENPEEVDEIIEGIVNYPAIMHNGTMYYHAVANSDKSDTYFFTRDIMSNPLLIDLAKKDEYFFEELIGPHISTSRLAIVFPDETETILAGLWYEYKGLMFSKDYKKEYEDFKKTVIKFNNYNYNKGNSSRYNSSVNYYEDDSFNDYYNNYYEELPIYKQIESGVINDNYSSKFIIDIPSLPEDRRGFVNSAGIPYELYMGLYLPREDDYNDFVVEVDSFNYKDITLDVVRSDYINGIYSGNKYYITNVTGDHLYVCREGSPNNEIEVYYEDFYAFFSLKLNGYSIKYYSELYKLIKKIRVTKSSFKKINKALDNNICKKNDTTSFNYNKERFTVDNIVLADFLEKMEEELKIQKDPALLLF